MENDKTSECGRRLSRVKMISGASIVLMILLNGCVPTHGQAVGNENASRDSVIEERKASETSALLRRVVGMKEPYVAQAVPEAYQWGPSLNVGDQNSNFGEASNGNIQSTHQFAEEDKPQRRLSGVSCAKTILDFSSVEAGMYVEDEFSEYGLKLSAEGGYGSLPRVYDSENPVADLDLGSPNKRCDGGGPGVGEGGEPDRPGKNCEKLGNVLIIQETRGDVSIPNDNRKGGKIKFEFTSPAQYVYEIGLLDMDRDGVTLTVSYEKDGKVEVDVLDVPNLGDNSAQTFPVHTANVKELILSIPDSGAVTFLSFCPPDDGGHGENNQCTPVPVDFSKTADGKPVKRGDYVGPEWSGLGFTLSSSGGFGNLPRVFDTSDPGTMQLGDPDLGSPNEACGGPGKGKGGRPGTEGENCKAVGNALIIQEVNDDMSVPDDNADGGSVVFDFDPVAEYVSEIGLLDVDYMTEIKVVYEDGGGKMEEKKIRVPELGDNSVQTLSIDTANVKQLVVTMRRSCAIFSISYCPPPLPTPAPTPPPVTSPTRPPATCRAVDVDFSKSASGATIPRGAYLENEFDDFGLTLSSSGGFGNLPRVFDTSNPGTMELGDPDLGSPNEACPSGGPGTGKGGKPGTKGENCVAVGNALIIQEVNDDMSVPDDNVDGGSIVFEFDPVAEYVSEIGLLDVDYMTAITIESESGVVKKKVPELGDNSAQTFSIDTANVKKLVVTMRRSCAIFFISFCYPLPPTPPSETPPPSYFPTPEGTMSMSMPVRSRY